MRSAEPPEPLEAFFRSSGVLELTGKANTSRMDVMIMCALAACLCFSKCVSPFRAVCSSSPLPGCTPQLLFERCLLWNCSSPFRSIPFLLSNSTVRCEWFAVFLSQTATTGLLLLSTPWSLSSDCGLLMVFTRSCLSHAEIPFERFVLFFESPGSRSSDSLRCLKLCTLSASLSSGWLLLLKCSRAFGAVCSCD